VAEIKLEAVERAFARWRRAKRSPGGRVPDGLWDQAAAAAQAHGRSRTAKRLGLNHSILKREGTFELENETGRRLRVALRGVTPREVGAIACQLWRADR